MKGTTLLIVGNGILAGHVLYILSHGCHYDRIVLASRDMERVTRRANMLRQHAINMGQDVVVTPCRLDLDDIPATAAVFEQVSPDVVFNTASLQSWWVVTTLPAPLREKVGETRFGPWLPMQLSPTLKLMQAAKEAASDAIFVNAAFPDAVNPVLARNGLAPDLGIGNIANVVPALRIAVSDALEVSPSGVDVRVCAHHFVSYRLSRLGHPDGAPLFFRASVNGCDVTEDLDCPAIFEALAGRYRRTSGVEGQPVTASSAVAVLEALQSRNPILVHAPGPDGLPGGYPMRVSKAERALSLPSDFPLEKAIEVNEQGQVHDGIARIEGDGTVCFAEPQIAAMKALFKFECRKLQVGDAHEAATELGAKYRQFLSQHSLAH